MLGLNEQPEKGTWHAELGALFVAIFIVSLSEIFRFAPDFSESARMLGLGNYITALGAIGVLAVVINLALPFLLSKVAARFLPLLQLPILLIFAAVFGGLWQSTLMEGDGIRGLSYFNILRIAGWICGPLFLALWTWGWLKLKGPVKKRRHVLAIFVGLFSLGLSHAILQSYQAFHAYLLLFAIVMLAWGMSAFIKFRALGYLLPLVTVASVLIAFFLPGWGQTQRCVQGSSHVYASLLKLPASNPFELQPKTLIDPDTKFTKNQRAAFRKALASNQPKTKKARGKNVLFIVLESTRADTWADPKIAPNFHKWKSNGTYFPKAIAQYPATPLAYGAMFTSQPPSILTQTPAWSKRRLFDELVPSFENFIFTRPKNIWFDKGAITGFFVPKDVKPNKHRRVKDALSFLKRKLVASDEENFFAWAHIYEPHQPWVPRKSFMSPPGSKGKKGTKAAYLSEVRLVDDELGKFMDWFYAQPLSEETLVVIYSDHGEGVGEIVEGKKFNGHHVHVRNMISHIPAYFSGPGIPKGKVVEDFTVQHMDAMPTIFDFMGKELPADFYAQGRSVYDLLENPKQRPLITEAFSIRGKEFFKFVESVKKADPKAVRKRFRETTSKGKYSPKIGLQFGDEKLIKDMLLGRVWIYDIKKDPNEKKDLSSSDPDRKKAMEDRLQNWVDQQSFIIGELEKK